MSGHLILLVILVTCQMVTSIPAPMIPDINGTETKTTSTSNNQNMTSNMLEEQDYFEGDLDISEELIQAYYSNDSTDTMDLAQKAAIRDRNRLWSNGVMYYTLHNSLTQTTINRIRTAMQEWSRRTCLRFILRTRSSITDYTEFRSDGMGCNSNSVGRKGGRQVINLQPPRCINHGTIVHEIGHAVGFWHEQSRPDRNSYIRVNENNIEPERRGQFRVRTRSEVNYYGTRYDYGSIMHYPSDAFSRNRRPTIEVTNTAEYDRQRRPMLGQRVQLSDIDVQQANRLYSCSSSSNRIGYLSVQASHANNLPDEDGWLAGRSDPYMQVVATDILGFRETRRSRYIQGNQSPRWNQRLWFSGRRPWYRVEVTVYDSDIGSDDRLTVTAVHTGVNNIRGSRSASVRGTTRGRAYYTIYFAA